MFHAGGDEGQSDRSREGGRRLPTATPPSHFRTFWPSSPRALPGLRGVGLLPAQHYIIHAAVAVGVDESRDRHPAHIELERAHAVVVDPAPGHRAAAVVAAE